MVVGLVDSKMIKIMKIIGAVSKKENTLCICEYCSFSCLDFGIPDKLLPCWPVGISR